MDKFTIAVAFDKNQASVINNLIKEMKVEKKILHTKKAPGAGGSVAYVENPVILTTTIRCKLTTLS